LLFSKVDPPPQEIEDIRYASESLLQCDKPQVTCASFNAAPAAALSPTNALPT
jgi:hypothetical protein